MKKYLKVSLIVLGVLMGIILLDSIQALIFNIGLQCTQLIVSNLQLLTPAVLRGIRLRKSLITRCVHCSAKEERKQKKGRN